MTKRETLRGQVEERLLAVILSANRARIYDELLRGANVNIDRALYPVLSATAAIGPARISEVAEILAINPTTTSRHLSSLERAGLISRTPDETDARAAFVELTEAGTRAVHQLRETRRALFVKLLADFDSGELKSFNDYLGRLIDAFTEQP
jgi:DNA-binding MarR family transcriptional regulator